MLSILLMPSKNFAENTWLLPEKYAQNPYYDKSYAVMVGIDDYPGWWPDLSFGKNDVYVLEKRMKIHGFESVFLFDKAASKQKILDTIRKDLAPRVKYNENILFFFAGHTYTKPDKKGKDVGYLVCYDTRLKTIESSGIKITELADLLGSLKCKHSYIMIDGCVSGTKMVREKRYAPDSKEFMKKVSSNKAVQIIVAGSNNQSLVEIGGIGLLVRNFVDALNGGADSNFDGFLTASEIGIFLRPTISYISSGFHVPEYGNYSGTGENIFKVIGKISLDEKGMPEDIYGASNYSLYDLPQVIYTSRDKTEMVLVPGGKFTFGSNSGYENEKPAYKVLLNSFYIDRHEVTNAQYQLFNSNHKRSPLSACDECPVTNVSWYDATAYSNWAGKRLPTEAEWEKAARGRLGRRFSYGNSFNPKLAWSNLPKHHGASPVSQLPPSYEGVYDMSGNVWEWCAGWYDVGYYKLRVFNNPMGPVRGREKIIKGGSWVDKQFGSRTSLRKGINPEKKMFNIGFRLAKSP